MAKIKETALAALFSTACLILPAVAEEQDIHRATYVFPTLSKLFGNGGIAHALPKEYFKHQPDPEDFYQKHLEYAKNFNTRKILSARTVDFDGRGPHYLKLYIVGEAGALFDNHCILVVDAVDRKTQKATSLIESIYPNGVEDYVYANNDLVYKNLDGVAYSFKISKCESSLYKQTDDGLQMQITQDLSDRPESKSARERNKQKLAPNNLGDNVPTSITVRFDDARPQLKVVFDELRYVPKNTKLIRGMGNTKSGDIAFERSDAIGGSVGILGLGVEKTLLKSFEAKFGQASESSISVEVDGSTCEKWRIIGYEAKQLGYFSAPKMGIEKEYSFGVITDQKIVPINLCAHPEYEDKEKRPGPEQRF